MRHLRPFNLTLLFTVLATVAVGCDFKGSAEKVIDNEVNKAIDQNMEKTIRDMVAQQGKIEGQKMLLEMMKEMEANGGTTLPATGFQLKEGESPLAFQQRIFIQQMVAQGMTQQEAQEMWTKTIGPLRDAFLKEMRAKGLTDEAATKAWEEGLDDE